MEGERGSGKYERDGFSPEYSSNVGGRLFNMGKKRSSVPSAKPWTRKCQRKSGMRLSQFPDERKPRFLKGKGVVGRY